VCPYTFYVTVEFETLLHYTVKKGKVVNLHWGFQGRSGLVEEDGIVQTDHLILKTKRAKRLYRSLNNI
jgi:hypothetical protein